MFDMIFHCCIVLLFIFSILRKYPWKAYSLSLCSEFFLHNKYQDEIDFLVSNPKRIGFIKNLAVSLDGNPLVLFQYVEKHGKVL